MVYFTENPIYKWMITKGTPILGNAQITMEKARKTRFLSVKTRFFTHEQLVLKQARIRFSSF
jgi:hypothetical protein